MPRSIAEVNAIRRSNQRLTESSAPGQPVGHGRHGYDPNQPRLPSGHHDGGQWTDEPGSDGPAASRREVVLDESGEEAWESVTSSHRPDGTLAEQEVINRDGSRIHSQFSRDSRIAGWDERHTVILPDGQQVTFENSGDVQTIYDADGQPISASVWSSRGPEALPIMQQAFFQAAPVVGAAAGEALGVELGVLAAAAALFTWLSSRNTRDGTAVLAFKAGDYRKNDKPEVALVGRLTRDEVKKTCNELDDVQGRTDKAVDFVRTKGEYMGPADFGTKVHKMIADGINGENRPDYKAEVSGMKSGQAAAKYGQKGSIRIDAYERLDEISTTCVYDPKTGERGLSLPRMMELAQTAYRLFGTKRMIVIEVRPGQQ